MENDETDYSKLIEDVAADIKRKFIDLNFELFPNMNIAAYYDSKHDRHYRAAAEYCCANDVEPNVFVRAQFRGNISQPLLPFILSSKYADGNYQSICTQDIPPEAEYNVQVGYLRNQLYKTSRTLETILLDDDIPFTAWFRICISTKPIKAVIDKYKQEAKTELTDKLIKFMATKNLDTNRITKDELI